jgi:hypothetical protein
VVYQSLETQDVYHLSCYHFNYMIINHLEYWNVYSLLIATLPNNVNKIQEEGVEDLFTQLANIYWGSTWDVHKVLTWYKDHASFLPGS